MEKILEDLKSKLDKKDDFYGSVAIEVQFQGGKINRWVTTVNESHLNVGK